MSDDSNSIIKVVLGLITIAAFGVIIWQGIVLYKKYTKSDFSKVTESLQKTVWKARPPPPPLDEFSGETPTPTPESKPQATAAVPFSDDDKDGFGNFLAPNRRNRTPVSQSGTSPTTSAATITPKPTPTEDPSKVIYIYFNDKGDGGELSLPLLFGSSKPTFQLVEVTKYGDEPPIAVFRITWSVTDQAGVPISTKCIKMGDVLMLYGSEDKDAPVTTVTVFSKI